MNESVLNYKTAMAVFKSWHNNGTITDADLRLLEAKLADKYGLSNRSIYREKT